MVNNTNNSSEFALAVANLAAAAIAANPDLSMDMAVANARRLLGADKATARQIADSVQNERILCLEDGTWHVMLRRYLRRKYGLSPQQYRARWGLPADYPMTAPAYRARRSKIAKKHGLGKK